MLSQALDMYSLEINQRFDALSTTKINSIESTILTLELAIAEFNYLDAIVVD